MNAVAKGSGGRKSLMWITKQRVIASKWRWKKRHVLIKTNIYLVCDTVNVSHSHSSWLAASNFMFGSIYKNKMHIAQKRHGWNWFIILPSPFFNAIEYVLNKNHRLSGNRLNGLHIFNMWITMQCENMLPYNGLFLSASLLP